jgi:flagellar hook-length control protein FliK
MLTPSVLPNLPLDHPAKKTISAADTSETMQGPESAGFGKVLAREMSNKPDTAGTKPANKNTEVGKDENRVTATDGSARGDTSINGGEDMPSLEIAEKSESAISTTPQLMEFANMLPHLAGQPAQVPDEVPTATRIHAHLEHRLNMRAIDVQSYAQSRDEASNAPGKKVATSADPLADVAQVEVERGGVATDYAAFGNQPPGLILGSFVQSRTGAGPDATAIHRGTSQIAGISPGIRAANAPAGVAAGVLDDVQDEARAGRSAAQSTTATRFDADARQDDSRRLESGLMKNPSASEFAILANTSADAPPRNLSAIQAEAAFSTVAIEQGLAPTSNSPASSLDHSPVRLEPHPGSAGWDNALGQKIVWMVSQQQQIAELSLNPPDLGPLQIVLTVDNDQASAMFVSHNADVRQALEAALPRLKEMMADSGISLGNTTISSGNSQQGTFTEGFERRNHSGAHYAGGSVPANTSDSDRASLVNISVRGLVDTFA